MPISILIRSGKAAVVAGFTAAMGLGMLWPASPAASMMMRPQALSSFAASSITPARCLKEHCYLPSQYMRPGFDPKKEAPLGGPGKPNPGKDAREHHLRCATPFGSVC